ncbi:MAG: hypothetical protein ACOC2G_04205 [Bacillota bacterium]
MSIKKENYDYNKAYYRNYSRFRDCIKNKFADLPESEHAVQYASCKEMEKVFSHMSSEEEIEDVKIKDEDRMT